VVAFNDCVKNSFLNKKSHVTSPFKSFLRIGGRVGLIKDEFGGVSFLCVQWRTLQQLVIITLKLMTEKCTTANQYTQSKFKHTTKVQNI
jgi:hypothetical protein